jgi:hypothetical protein
VRPPRFDERSLDPRLRGLRQRLLRRLSRRFVHRHRVSRVRVGVRDFKRIRFGDAFLADRAASALEHFAGSGIVPALEARFDDELLVEFVAGERLARLDIGAAPSLARFYARVHAGGSRLVPVTEARASEHAHRDLSFLRDVAVVDAACARDLGEAIERLAPERVRIGWDYTDAVPKNFVRRADGTLVGVDVGALCPDALVGTGIAKSFARGDAAYRSAFLEAFAASSDLDLDPSLPFVELCFHLAWLKNRCLKGSRLEPSRLARFRPQSSTSGRANDHP